jgi:glutaredoxin
LGIFTLIHKITVLSKEGCHLCERAIDTLRNVSNPHSFNLEIVDISKDRVLFEKYFLKIPVIRVDDTDVFEVEQIALPTDCRTRLENLVKNLT